MEDPKRRICDRNLRRRFFRRKVKRKVWSSLTRFGEFSSFWANFNICLPNIWQNFEPNLTNLLRYWANIHCCKLPKCNTPSGHSGLFVARNLNDVTSYPSECARQEVRLKAAFWRLCQWHTRWTELELKYCKTFLMGPWLRWSIGQHVPLQLWLAEFESRSKL